MNNLFDDHADEGWGFLFDDARNAFNSISRPVALWNCRILWSRCSRYLFNSYRGYAVLILKGTERRIVSREGFTQGDSLAMQGYAVGILPLILKLKNPEKWIQTWFADDSACAGKLKLLLEWLLLLMQEGPKIGYHLELSKCFLVVAPQFLEEAKELFSSYGVQIVTGRKFLGGFIGKREDIESWLQKK